MKITFSLVALCAVLVLGVASLPISTGGSAQADDANFSTSAHVASATVARGGTAAITAIVTNRASATSASVDVEIYDASGAKWFERAYDGEWFNAGQTINHQISWTVPASAPLGPYSIQVGVFSADWSTQHTWNDTAGSVTVGGSSTGGGGATSTPTRVPPINNTSTPTRIPTNTKTPTPVPAASTSTPTPVPAASTSTPTAVPAANTSTPTSVPVSTSTPTRGPTNTSTPTQIPSPTPTTTGNGGGGGRMAGLHIVGNQIQNSAGAAVQLIGVNRSSAEYMCTSNSGTVFDGPADQGEATAMKAWNVHAVRVVLNEDCWLGINGANPSGAAYQNAVANYVNILTSNNIAAIINLHFNAPGGQLATGQQVMADRDHSPAFWSSVANRFKGNSSVLFEPYNEPHPDGGSSTTAAWSCWRDGGDCGGAGFTVAGMQEMVNAIRGTGATNIIVLTGQNWGSQLDQWLQFKPNDPLNQLAAGWHSYGDGLSCQDETCWNSTLVSVLQQVPIVATEIGEFDCQHSYIDRVMNFLDQHGQSYQAWSWGPFSCTADPALLTDWAGTPNGAYGQGYKDHLNSRP